MGKQKKHGSVGIQTPPGRTGNTGVPDISTIVEKTVANIVAHLPSSTKLSSEEMTQLKEMVQKAAQSSSRTDNLVVHAFTTYQDVADSMIKQLTQQIMSGGLEIQPEAVAAQTLMGVQLTNASLAQAKSNMAKKKLESALELWNEKNPQPAPKQHLGVGQPFRPKKPKPY